MGLDADFLKSLIEAEDPLEPVWKQMLSIWQIERSEIPRSGAEAYPDDVVAFYNERETALSQFESALYYGYFEMYDLLLDRAGQQVGGYVQERMQGDSVVFIADSLSVREVGLLQKRLGERGFGVEVEGFAVAPFPTLTESLSGKLLGTHPAGGKDMPDFRYRYVAGPGEVPNLPDDERTLVWLRLPDKELEQVTVSQATTVADALNVTIETLIHLLEQATGRAAFITSDHGYLYATAPSHYWEIPKGAEDNARKVFPRESRAQPIRKAGATGLRYHEAGGIDQRYFVFTDTYVGIRGRFWWAGGSANDRCTAHGGLSLAESFVPVLRVI